MTRYRMQSPKLIIGNGVANWAGRVKLPPGERIQVIHLSPGTIAYQYGNVISGALYPAIQGAGQILIHPGEEVFILLSQAIGTQAYIHVVGNVTDQSEE